MTIETNLQIYAILNLWRQRMQKGFSPAEVIVCTLCKAMSVFLILTMASFCWQVKKLLFVKSSYSRSLCNFQLTSQACFWTLGGSQRTWTQGEHANCAQIGPSPRDSKPQPVIVRRLPWFKSLLPSSFLLLPTEQDTVKMGCFGFLKVMMFVFNGIIFVSSCDFLFYRYEFCVPHKVWHPANFISFLICS